MCEWAVVWVGSRVGKERNVLLPSQIFCIAPVNLPSLFCFASFSVSSAWRYESEVLLCPPPFFCQNTQTSTQAAILPLSFRLSHTRVSRSLSVSLSLSLSLSLSPPVSDPLKHS